MQQQLQQRGGRAWLQLQLHQLSNDGCCGVHEVCGSSPCPSSSSGTVAAAHRLGANAHPPPFRPLPPAAGAVVAPPCRNSQHAPVTC
jgi:hypothetical protein